MSIKLYCAEKIKYVRGNRLQEKRKKNHLGYIPRKSPSIRNALSVYYYFNAKIIIKITIITVGNNNGNNNKCVIVDNVALPPSRTNCAVRVRKRIKYKISLSLRLLLLLLLLLWIYLKTPYTLFVFPARRR